MLGWKEKLADKLSAILSDSSKNTGSNCSDPCTVPLQPQGAAVAEGDFYGPDTSSLSAFLFSLLPSAGTGSNDNSSSQNVEYEVSSAPDSGNSVRQKNLIEESLRQDEISDYKLVFETHGTREDDSGVYEDNEWEVVTEIGSKTRDTSDQDWVLQKAIPSLPDLSDESLFLSDNLREFLNACLPTVVKGCQWVLLYSTQKHGMSLLTLTRKSNDLPGPCLLVTGDMEGAVFGGLLNGPLKPTPKKKYQGTNQTFVFTTVYGEPRLFRSTGSSYSLFLQSLLSGFFIF
ncbi:uncharacterized protein LOC131072461 [Cryptomeria japonica]|uniref:uncharacterized protein LOC131072461 n=1 Tax=Cryptomeria japonica TaxID=3369 RepID=UPI0025AC54D2|nr:uncharacterized protein LOC131072461 [Cryptomeria japonica]